MNFRKEYVFDFENINTTRKPPPGTKPYHHKYGTNI